MSSPEPHAAAHNSHGNTPAAWTAVTIMLVAVAIGTWAVIDLNWTLFWASVGLLAVGAVVGKVMQMLGFGASADHHRPASSDAGRREPSVVQAERSTRLLRGESVERDDDARSRGESRAVADDEETDVFGQYDQDGAAQRSEREPSGRD